MTTILKNLSIANYRSFGSTHQKLVRLSSINLIIGKNNAGKSNILRFLSEELPAMNTNGSANRDPYFAHNGQAVPIEIGFSRAIDEIADEINVAGDSRSSNALHLLKLAFPKNVVAFSTWQLQSNGTSGRALKLHDSEWRQHLGDLDDQTLHNLWSAMVGRSGGGRDAHWIPELATAMAGSPPSAEVHFIPAKRELRRYRQSNGSEISILEKLASIERPAANDKVSRDAFSAFQQFVRSVLGDDLATVEVQSDRSTINVELGGRILPVESLGSGVSEVILLAAATTAIHGKVVCLEEPEIHLNPLLQKQLISYLAERTDNQYFIATHSASLMDAKGAEIYHVRLEGAQSVVRRATSDPHRTDICSDLGYHPSDLLIANCVIWVEGPSDRIYLNWWIKAVDDSLLEGVHYSIMFYGGRVASHLTFSAKSSDGLELGKV
jgi:predicted ATPase